MRSIISFLAGLLESLQLTKNRVISEGNSVEGINCLNNKAKTINSLYEGTTINQTVTDLQERVLGEGNKLEGYACIYNKLTSIENVDIALAGTFNYDASGGNSTSNIVTPQNNITRSFYVEPDFNSPDAGVVAFDFISDTIDSTTFGAGDDTAPVQLFGRFLGASHGYLATNATATGHGKTTDDVGSIYNGPSGDVVICGILDLNTLLIADRLNDSAISTGTYTHVSGGNNTSDIIVTSASAQQLYPPFQNKTISVLIDGEEVTQTDTYKFTDKVEFIESYDLLAREDIINWFINSSDAGSYKPSGLNAIARITQRYVYDLYGNVVLYVTFTALRDISELNSIFTVQSGLKTADGNSRYYVPKALPFSADSQSWDFAEIEDYTTKPWSIALDFTPSRVSSTGLYADRVIQIGDNYNNVIGILPELDGADRSTLAPSKALQLFSTGKVYMSAVDPSPSAVVSAGTVYNFVSYRSTSAIPSGGQTAFYTVRTDYGNYTFFDFHSDTGGNVFTVPGDLVGRHYTIVESSNINTPSSGGIFEETITVSVNNNDNGYLILKS